VFERFTERARQVVVLAQEEARTLKHNYIGTEHILLGLLREEEGVAARVLASFGLTVEAVRGMVVSIVGSSEDVTVSQIPFTPRAKKVLELALREAQALRHSYVGTEHILLGLVCETEGVAARILLDSRADADKVRGALLEQLGAGAGRPDPGQAAPTVSRGRGARAEWVGPIELSDGVQDLLSAAAARSLEARSTEVDLPELLMVIAEDESALTLLATLLSDEEPGPTGPQSEPSGAQ
jgi:ATP-dependent Clp protease ATP-binding subunit ClpC